MELVLIPGFWLDASSWDAVVPILLEAGHRVRALTLPGLESGDADRRSIGLRDHVDAVVEVIDRAQDPVVLIGHSGGGAIALAATDARPERVARLIFVDSIPLGHGQAINHELPVVDGEIPLPDWSTFYEEDLRDLDEEGRAAFRARAIPQPARVAQDLQVLSDERRHDVPVTLIACEFGRENLEEWIAAGEPEMAELAAMRNFECIDLPTGHWPQLTRPAELARAVLSTLAGQ